MDEVCRNSFRGDTPMMTIFRANAISEKCPFDAPFNFTYQFIDGSCVSRTSSVSSCANPHRFRIHYQACPENVHTDTHADEIECIAQWDLFGVEYFAAKLTNHFGTSPSSKYRCFIHQRTPSGGRMGISADASCRELTDISLASTILNYKLDIRITPQCHFPSFLRHDHHSSSPRSWTSIVSAVKSRFEKEEWTEENHGKVSSISLCIQEENLGHLHRLVVHARHGCNSGYQCVQIKKRSKSVIEVIRGRLTTNEFDACNEMGERTVDNFLLDHSPQEKCPIRGEHQRVDCPHATLHYGCPSEHAIHQRPSCSSNISQTIICRGHWIEDEVHYIIAEDAETGEKLCTVSL
ncbi:hypothetical protein AB6A40_006694 [Gnathostoma spinigerum]|uniref:Uncharacterized protein n=1 Tax=Gnathostoma spinigerum TaxID=75299 RepID=A0ABD6EJ30_9BILA